MASQTYKVTQEPPNRDELIPPLVSGSKIETKLMMAGEAPILRLRLLKANDQSIPHWTNELVLFRSNSGKSASNSYWRAGQQYHFIVEFKSSTSFDFIMVHAGPGSIFDIPIKLDATSPLLEHNRERRGPLRLGDVLRGLEIDASPGAWNGGSTDPEIPTHPDSPIYHTGTWHANQN